MTRCAFHSPKELVIVMTSLVTWIIRAGGADGPLKCVDVTIPMCRGIGYNHTYTPNQFHHDTQEEAGLEVHQFWPLVQIRCSVELRFFLCSLYAPICVANYDRPIPACRDVCERARAGCAPLMKQFGFAWPDRMACDQLPVYGADKNALCMLYSGGGDAASTSTSTSATTRRSTTGFAAQGRGGVVELDGFTATVSGSGVGDCACKCRKPFVAIRNQSSYHFDRWTTGGQHNCAVPCDGLYGAERKRFARIWIGLWSVLCLASTSMAAVTFVIDTRRFKYPERPIVYVIACYALLSLGYVVQLVAGPDEVACEPYGEGVKLIRYDSASGPVTCNLVFILIYFFGMAASVWWVVLSFTWFLSAGLKWGQEAVAGLSQYFHLAAWMLPTVQTIAILALSAVDGDPASGICYVGSQNLNNLRGFVLAPLAAYLTLGTFFLLAGFVSLMRIRRRIRQQMDGVVATEKLDRYILRVGVFSLLHTVPMASVIACYFYEHQRRPRAEVGVNCPCREEDGGGGGVVGSVGRAFAVAMFKHFMWLVVGITAGFWIWTAKTVESWKRFCGQLTGVGKAGRGGAGGQGKVEDKFHVVTNNKMAIDQRCGTPLSDCARLEMSQELVRKKLQLSRI